MLAAPRFRVFCPRLCPGISPWSGIVGVKQGWEEQVFMHVQKLQNAIYGFLTNRWVVAPAHVGFDCIVPAFPMWPPISVPRQSLWPELPTSWIPLDASAVLWNRLIRKLGVPEGATKEGLRFEEMYGVDDNRRELRQEYENIHALIIALPMKARLNERQRVEASDEKRSNNLLTGVLTDDIPRTADNHALALELNKPLEEAYTDVAIQGDSAFALEEPAMRYVCMVKSRIDGNLYHLDAKRNRPGSLGPSAKNVLSDRCLDHVNLVVEASVGRRRVTILALVSGQQPEKQLAHAGALF
ncbi:hypothetical protein P171DRAFT_489507 [Karstenula rhodostoma CBS 690.94]|uniref:ubiquitinyl hydrolase 1 n=1 Tax=Karstenula rhodostoma CBS 690.94 TaxID=1392251 RepID=A0A9P4P958_9PLEO|nr:hypothetical protein P171DRAFT_489507 [Karstenula rhodostoma CBS 690.94]